MGHPLPRRQCWIVWTIPDAIPTRDKHASQQFCFRRIIYDPPDAGPLAAMPDRTFATQPTGPPGISAGLSLAAAAPGINPGILNAGQRLVPSFRSSFLSADLFLNAGQRLCAGTHRAVRLLLQWRPCPRRPTRARRVGSYAAAGKAVTVLDAAIFRQYCRPAPQIRSPLQLIAAKRGNCHARCVLARHPMTLYPAPLS